MPDPRASFLITAENKASRVLRSLRGELKAASREVKGVAASFGGLGGLGAASALGSIVAITKGVIDVSLQTEKLRASLETVTGSAGAANAAFDQIKKFTTETPFQVNEVADSFIKLAAYGIEPTEGLLKSLGNTASAMGKTLDQAVEALADATTGEFERLKEFGIKARSEGDKVTFTFRGVTTTVGKNADEIRSYLQSIGETDFAGAMERQMSTLGGAFSNLQDAVFNLADDFASESGLTNSIKEATRAITELINSTSDGELAITRFGKGIGIAIAQFTEGDASLLGARRARIEELEDYEQELIGKLQKSWISISDTNDIKSRLEDTRQLIKVLKESLNDPEFQQLNRQGLISRLPEDTPKLTGPILPITSGNATRTTSAKSRKSGKSDAQKEAEQFARALRALQDELDPVSAKTRDYLENVALLDRAWAEGQISGERYQELMAVLATDVEAVREAEAALAADRERATDLIKSLDPGSTYRDQIIEVQRLRDQFPELSDALAEVELNAQEAWDKVGDGAVEAAEDAKSAWEDLGPVFSSAFEDAIVEGKNLRDVLKGLEQDIIRIATRKLVTEPLGNALSGFFGSSGAGGSFLKNLIPHFATGGSFMVGGSGGTDSQLVAFRASPSERVTVETPAQQRQSGGITIINQIQVPQDTAHFRRSARHLADQTMRDLGLQGGSF